MKYQLIREDVLPKWKNYRKFIPQIFEKIFTIIDDERKGWGATIVLIDDTHMHSMNLMYRNIDNSTDVLTFLSDEEEYLGDVFINVDRLTQQANDYGHSLKREFCFLVAHGALHLLGYDHLTKEEEKVMFSLQEEVLKEIAPRK